MTSPSHERQTDRNSNDSRATDAPGGSNQPTNETEPDEQHHSITSETSPGGCSETSPLKRSTKRKRSQAGAENDDASLATPDVSLGGRCRRRPDEIYDEWEKSEGRYCVAYPMPKASCQEQSAPLSVKGR
jgi:hypothetical protein